MDRKGHMLRGAISHCCQAIAASAERRSPIRRVTKRNVRASRAGGRRSDRSVKLGLKNICKLAQ